VVRSLSLPGQVFTWWLACGTFGVFGAPDRGTGEQQLEREDGLDKRQRPEVQRRQLEREAEDLIMLASPASQIGRRASRKMSQMSTPAAPGRLAFLAPRRWHTEDVAVQKLAARASKIALSVFPHSAFRSGNGARAPRSRTGLPWPNEPWHHFWDVHRRPEGPNQRIMRRARRGGQPCFTRLAI
jgi:hypothetical protein